MDRNWIRNPDRACDEYLSGIEEFIGVARNHVNYRGHIKYPCQNCNNCSWKSEKMLAKEDEYLAERAKEQQLPEDTPREDILVNDPDARLNILMSVVGVKPGRQIHGLGNGRL
ncbi:hypothetical protein LWI29_002720 [Acer saccharum]|uniref:Transposase-associated domain-containing protein n=1 Tax=Acer saccharum TaxID=4024 RepID=A0AA39T3Y1_ACESA|nr:hypothetical protein LWI29_002720 [Acer saccharum]